MRIAQRAACAALLLAAAPCAARAATEADFAARTTGDLVNLCAAQPDTALGSAALAFCFGFAQGAVAVQEQHDAGSQSGRLFCLPNPLPSRMDAAQAFVAWARAVPDRLATLPTDGLMAFLSQRFPCAGGQ